jgi:hypothetical protein
MAQRSLNTITCVIVHHSVAHKTLDIEDIDKMEKVSQSFLAVGYHAYTKCLDEKNDLWVVQQGRPLNKIPAAAYGMNNESYDICIGGNYEPGAMSFLDQVSPNALKAVADQIKLVKAKCPNLKFLIGHRDVATIKQRNGEDPSQFSTLCPGKLMATKLDDLRAATGLAQWPGI